MSEEPGNARVVLPERVEGAAILLAHADRCWKAAEANSARIAARANLVLSGVTAMLGLKLFLAGKEFDLVTAAPAGTPLYVFVAAWVLSLVFLGVALVKVLFGPRKLIGAPREGDTASGGLQLNQGAIDRPWAVPANYATVYVFLLTYRASTDLHERNKKRERSVDSAQKWLILGIAALFLAMFSYTWIAWDHNHAKEHADAAQPAGNSGDHAG